MKKQIWLRAGGICLMVAAAIILLGEALPLILLAFWQQKPTAGMDLGVIGGADGPTAIFVTASNWPGFTANLLLAAMLLVVGSMLLKKSK